MISLQSQPSFPSPSYQPNHNSKYKINTQPSETASERGMHQTTSSLSSQYSTYPAQTRSLILSHLASSSHPFQLLFRNTNVPLGRQDTQDLRELLNISDGDRWWEVDLDTIFCENCIKQQRLKPTLFSKIPFVSQQVYRCPHETTFSSLMHNIEQQVRARLSCLRITGSFQNPDQVASAIHNLMMVFPNIQIAQVQLPPASHGSIPEPSRIAYHMASLENFLPKGTALKFNNLLEHQEFMLEWVQIKRKWYEVVTSERESAQLNKIQEMIDSEGKLIGVSSSSINLNRGKGFT